MRMNEAAYLGQLGSLNSGMRKAAAAFDELRVWDAPRYDADFTPQRTGPATAPGLLHFAFEDNLLGRCRLDGTETNIPATFGAPAR